MPHKTFLKIISELLWQNHYSCHQCLLQEYLAGNEFQKLCEMAQILWDKHFLKIQVSQTFGWFIYLPIMFGLPYGLNIGMIRRVFVFEYYLKSKLNNSYYLNHFCYWFLYCWIDHKVGIILIYVLSIILGCFWRNIHNLVTFLQESHH